MEYLELYNESQMRRHLVRPGVTGLAQIRGRNSISWNEKFEADVEYVDNLSFINDMKIFVGTIVTVISGRGVSSDSQISMPPFRGNTL